ncbi:MAG TPA: serine hydrolase domain-containing protein [Thermoanaerobaculia bacterium]|nr:serine hydrolase domain-containing protein [Thermoanaerobaculia bacterium]
MSISEPRDKMPRLAVRLAVAVLALLAVGYGLQRSGRLGAAGGTAARAAELASAATEVVAGDALARELDRFLSALGAFGYSGSVLVARGHHLLLHKGYGVADRERRRPYTPATIFDVASISKQFCAAAILKLEMEGRLKVDDPIGKFLAGVPADKAEITLHQLLTHTSGLVDTLGDEYEPVSREEVIRRALAAPLQGPPGRRHRYSNAGYSLLAAVVEIVSGRPYGTYLRERLFAPAGMRHTGFRLPPDDLPLLAHGYTADGDWGTPLDHPWAADGPFWNLRGNGGILSTTGDLYLWHLALEGETVLSRAAKEKYFTPYVSEGRAANASYAYGWSVSKGPTGGRLISHIGGNNIFESDFRRYVDDGVVLIISSNSFDFSALAVSEHLARRLFSLPDPQPPAVAVGDPAVAARAAGVYALPSGERLRVTADGDGLAIAAEGRAGLGWLLGSLEEDDRELADEREAKLAAAVGAARLGQLAAYAKLVGLPPATAAAQLEGVLGPLRQRLGGWTDVAVLGAASRGGRSYTLARLLFERGSKVAEYAWAGPTVETVRYLDAVPGCRYIPAAGGGFASFDVRTGATVRASFELPPPGGGAGGALVLQTRDAQVRAQRER